MKKKIIRFFTRFKMRFYLWSKQSSFMKTYKEEVSSYEKTCFKICLKLISSPDSDFMIAPMSNKRYIRNNKFDMFVTMDYGRVEITNHVFNYNVKLSDRDWQRLTFIFDTETEKRRLGTEQEVSSQIKNSLQHVLEKLENRVGK
jgi:hypothetical protein